MRLTLAGGALLLLVGPTSVLAQDGAPAAGPPVAFAPVTGVPIPLQSVSGRFSSLNPLNQLSCPYKKVSGRVVSPRLMLVKEMACGRPGHDNLLVNVQLSNPADAAQMVTGRHVVITAKFKNAEEDRDPIFVAEFLIAEKAELVSGDPLDHSASPAQAFTSYLMCQAPELDALARQLGNELCVQSTIVANLTATGRALETAARAPANASPTDTVSGDPNAISCRFDPGVSDRHLSAIACARNSYWAWYQAKWRDPLSSTPAPP
ncbi:MAG TPA: hypothetical protein VK683_08750 [Rhizomicrobium sp.]|jgi:hypothetical protein|nr:hypothetical protein [Rhizomicrobium sp.]